MAYPAVPAPRRTTIDYGRLWAGGVASAVVAALAALVGFLVARGLFDVPVLAPMADGAWGDISTTVYAVGAALAALVATGVIQVLLLFTPAPYLFFGWIMGLAIVAGVVSPFLSSAASSSKVATAIINLFVGVAIWCLVANVASSAVRRATRRTVVYADGAASMEGDWRDGT
jgi:hypothetical protein